MNKITALAQLIVTLALIVAAVIVVTLPLLPWTAFLMGR